MITQAIHSQEAKRQISTMNQPGMLNILFRGTILTLSWQDVDALLNCQQQWWSVFYQIGLFDVRDTCIRTGFRGRNLLITLNEYDDFIQGLEEAYLQFHE